MAALHACLRLLNRLRPLVAAGGGLLLCYRLGARFGQPGLIATPARYRQRQQLLAARREAVDLAADWAILHARLTEPDGNPLARLTDARRIAGRWHACSAYVEAACAALADAANAVVAHPDIEAARAAAGPHLGTAALYLEALAGLP